jgi:hypothetical protein
MQYEFPHYTPPPEFVQPDYIAWKAVRVGMTRSDVVGLLGPPLDDIYRGGRAKPDDAYYSYGYLQMPMVPHPRTFSFLVGFDSQGTVFTKIDPFHGTFSENGKPSIPEIITPFAGATFSHYPRILDMRWYPSSGHYPITYAVEFGYCPREGTCYCDKLIESTLPFPSFITSFGGAQPGRFRIKAQNEFGESDWSDYRYFEFVV